MPPRINPESKRKPFTFGWDEHLVEDIKAVKPTDRSLSDFTQELVVESLQRRHPDFREYAAFRRQQQLAKVS